MFKLLAHFVLDVICKDRTIVPGETITYLEEEKTFHIVGKGRFSYFYESVDD